MSTSPPPIKRRRLVPSTSASNALSKPFKSPLKTPLQPKPANQLGTLNSNSQNEGKITPTSNLDSVKKINTASHAPSPSVSPAKPPISSSTSHQTQTPSKNQPNITTQHFNEELLSLQKRHTNLLNALTAARARLETSTQALQLESTPGKDAHLLDLIAKWRTASRAAAEELYKSARDRVNRMGGVQGLKEREKERRERMREWEEDERAAVAKAAQSERRGRPGGDNDEEGEEDGDADHSETYDDGLDEGQLTKRADAEEEEKAEDDEESGYTMAMMLQSLNVDLGVVGFDKEAQRWVD